MTTNPPEKPVQGQLVLNGQVIGIITSIAITTTPGGSNLGSLGSGNRR
jgi:hypothetical protein